MSHQASVVFVVAIVALFFASCVGGCVLDNKLGYEFKQAMAEDGMEEVVEMLPGNECPVRYWRKAKRD